MKNLSLRMKVLATAGLVGSAAAVASLGTFGSFTSTTSASQSIGSGTVVIGLGASGTATNRLTIGATKIVPGDTIQRQVQLSNTGTVTLSSIGLTTTASPSSLLDQNTTDGLQMTIKACSAAWTEGGIAPAYTYTCGGTTTTVVASRPVIGSAINLPALNSLLAGGVDHLVVKLTFPTIAPNTYQGLSSTITFSFLGTQRVGQSE